MRKIVYAQEPLVQLYIKVEDPSNWSTYLADSPTSVTDVNLMSLVEENARKYEEAWQTLARS